MTQIESNSVTFLEHTVRREAWWLIKTETENSPNQVMNFSSSFRLFSNFYTFCIWLLSVQPSLYILYSHFFFLVQASEDVIFYFEMHYSWSAYFQRTFHYICKLSAFPILRYLLPDFSSLDKRLLTTYTISIGFLEKIFILKMNYNGLFKITFKNILSFFSKNDYKFKNLFYQKLIWR